MYLQTDLREGPLGAQALQIVVLVPVQELFLADKEMSRLQ